MKMKMAKKKGRRTVLYTVCSERSLVANDCSFLYHHLWGCSLLKLTFFLWVFGAII